MTKRKKQTDSWYWISGLTKLHGVKTWVNLYCARDERAASVVLNMIEHGLANPASGDAKVNTELATLKRYRVFRVTPPGADPSRCPACASNHLKRVKRDSIRMFRCLNCKNLWQRSSEKPSKPSKKPSKGRKPVPEGKTRTHNAKQAHKRAQKPVSVNGKRSKAAK